jgi:hypothetical protein
MTWNFNPRLVGTAYMTAHDNRGLRKIFWTKQINKTWERRMLQSKELEKWHRAFRWQLTAVFLIIFLSLLSKVHHRHHKIRKLSCLFTVLVMFSFLHSFHKIYYILTDPYIRGLQLGIFWIEFIIASVRITVFVDLSIIRGYKWQIHWSSDPVTEVSSL